MRFNVNWSHGHRSTWVTRIPANPEDEIDLGVAWVNERTTAIDPVLLNFAWKQLLVNLTELILVKSPSNIELSGSASGNFGTNLQAHSSPLNQHETIRLVTQDHVAGLHIGTLSNGLRFVKLKILRSQLSDLAGSLSYVADLLYGERVESEARDATASNHGAAIQDSHMSSAGVSTKEDPASGTVPTNMEGTAE